MLKQLPEGPRKAAAIALKALVTVGAFYLLLTHSTDGGDGKKIRIIDAIRENVATLELASFLPFVLAAAGIKAIGIFSSMLRWHLLLIGQGIRFNFWHVIGSFLIGRFLGTFLPSTIGLDGYKLYDAARFSTRTVEPAAATAVEKVMGMSCLFLTFLATLPLGWSVLHDSLGALAGPTAAVTVVLAIAIVGGLFLLIFKPSLVDLLLRFVPRFARARIEGFVRKMSQAAATYRGKTKLLVTVAALSFLVHFTTAGMYYMTARAVGAEGAEFWKVTFASSIQIFATVLSPFTIAGEGIREIAQVLLLKKHLGAGQAITSAALGFWAAEAMTMVGAIFWWARKQDYVPRRVEVGGTSGLAA
jgi:glycosyltransferase 2 family protein